MRSSSHGARAFPATLVVLAALLTVGAEGCSPGPQKIDATAQGSTSGGTESPEHPAAKPAGVSTKPKVVDPIPKRIGVEDPLPRMDPTQLLQYKDVVFELRDVKGKLHERVPSVDAPRSARRAVREYAGIHRANQSVKMIGGVAAAADRLPSMAALLNVDGQNNIYLVCGGTVIRDRWLLTAAHCPITSNSVAVVGVRDLAVDDYSLRVIAKVCRPPSYVEGDRTTDRPPQWDVALVKLQDPLGTSAAKLAYRGTTLGGEVAGTPEAAMGYGFTIKSGNASMSLLEAPVSVVADDRCAAAYPTVTITPQMMCAGPEEGGKGFCSGDSGGPLLWFEATSIRWVQTGIISWDERCAEAGYPGIYTRMSQVADWVDQTIAGDPACPDPTD